jgi:hypothetical protein
MLVATPQSTTCVTPSPQVFLKFGAGERAPGSFRYKMILGLPIQFGQQLRPVGREINEVAGLFRASRGAASGIYEYGRKVMAAERCRQAARVPDNVRHRMHGRERRNPLLQIDNDQRGSAIERGCGHGLPSC